MRVGLLGMVVFLLASVVAVLIVVVASGAFCSC